MLSKTAFVLIGLLKEKPMNPYEIIKVLSQLNISKWSPISSSGVYTTIHSLDKNGVIVGEKFKNSAMPEKTVYTVTAKGEKQFLETMINVLKNEVRDITKFNLCTLFICHLQKADVISILKERLENVERHIQGTKNAQDKYRLNNVPEFALLAIMHSIDIYEAERISITKMIAEIEKAETWNHFITIEV